MSLRRQFVFWGAALAVVILVLYLLGPILLPFVAGMAIAYMLDPVADRLQRIGFGRLSATIFILVIFTLMLVVVLVALAPLLWQQGMQLLSRLPDYLDRLDELLRGVSAGLLDTPWLRDLIGEGTESGSMNEQWRELASGAAAWLGNFAASLLSGGMAFVNFIALLVVTPVVAFYLLNDWDRLVDHVDTRIPREHVDTVRRLAREIDYSVAGFVRGQALVCVVLGLFYAISLTLAGLNFGLLIGFGAGIISFIPFVGSIVGFVLSVGVALVQFWPDWLMILLIAAIFMFGNFVEGNFLQPKLVGEKVGLHPVWLIFALFAFGYLFGFVGMLVAVPVAAAAGVLVRFAMQKYLESPLYHGVGPRKDEP